MSMYKTIFWSEAYSDYAAGDQVQSISGEVLVFGESAFASLDEAVAAVPNQNAIIVKVASGKYDGFTVVNQDGVAIEASQVVAVDFNGADVMVGGENLAIKASALDPIEQADIISGLNDIKAAEGTVYVAAEYAPADASPMFIGAGNPATVVGGSATVVYGNNVDEVVSQLGNMLSPENTVTAAANATQLLVSTDYNSSTEGFGTTKFSSYSAAYAYATANNKSATIVIEKAEAQSGNSIDNNHKNYKSMNLEIKDGSTLWYSGNKLDMTYDVVVRAGASLKTNRGKNSTTYTHIKDGGSLTIGEAGSAKKAVLDFGTSANYHNNDVAVLWQGSLTAYNAIIKVGDFGFTGTASFTDCEVDVEGIVAFGKGWSSQTMTNTTMNVKGNFLRNDNSYFNPSGTLLNNLTMTNSTINVNDGVEGTSAQKVTIKTLTMKSGSSVKTDGAVEVTGTLTMDSSSTLFADSLTFGSSGKINVTLLDGFKLGDKIIDVTGANGLTSDILSKITFSGAKGYEADIVDGDIVIAKASVKVDKGTLDLSKDDAFTKEGATLGSAENDLTIETGAKDSTDVTDTAEIKSDVVGKDITLNNSKNLVVTGSIEATGTATLTNKGNNIVDEEGNLVAEAVLNGGYDDKGNEKAAKIEAEKIVLQNDGHAKVELTAKDINIANNSNETLTGIIGNADTNSVVIAAGTATADGVIIDGTLDGSIEDANVTAKNISIANQTVSDSTFNGRTAIAADSTLSDTTVNGVVSVGFDAENAADTTLTLKGESHIGTLYVGKEGRENQYTAKIAGADANVTLDNLYNRTGSAVEFTDDATVNIGYWQSKGSVVIDDATVNHTGVNMYVYNNDSEDAATITLKNGATLNSNANYAIYLGNSEGGPAKGSASLVLESGSTLNTKNLTLHAAGTLDNAADGAATSTSVSVTDSTLNVTGTLTNNSTVTVAGTSTLNIAAATGNSIDLLDGAIIKDSTVGGDAFIAGNVTFRGDNTFGMITDFGNLTDYYGTTAPMQWTVEEGASLTLTKTARYGLGYGDKVVVNGTISAGGASDARATLTDDNAENDVKQSLFMHGLVAQESKGWNENSSMTVNNAYVTIGSNNSFGNKPGNYGGTYTFNFNNTVLDSSRITFYEALSKTSLTFKDSDVKTGTFMTRDADSVFTLDNTKLVSSTATNGNDEGNYNAGTLNIVGGSDLTYTAELKNEGGVINVTDSSLTANGGIVNNGTITVTDSTLKAASIANNGTISLTVTADKLASLGNDAYYIINQTGSGAAVSDKVTIAGTEYSVGDSITINDVKYSVVEGDGNDIAIKAAAKILTVNSSYTEDTPGFGFSKFNKFEDALQAASSEATAIKLESDVKVDSEIGYYNLPADLSIVADENVTLDMAGASFYPMGKKTLVVGENVEITNMGQMIAYESQVILNGDFAGAHLWTFGFNGDAENGATGLTINETSKVTVATQLEFRGGDVTINGNITDTSAALGDADQIQLLGTTYGAWGGSSGYATKVNLNDTYIKLAQNTIGGANTKFQDGSSAIVTMDNSIYETAAEGAFSVASTGLVKAENGSIIYINSGVRASNAGTINITDSTFESKSAFTNSGTINVSGESTLKINKLTGEAIEILDGATISDSSVNGAVNLVSGTINFAGENAFTGGMLSAGYYNYAEDLTVNITGDFTASNMVAWGGNANKTTVNVGAEDAEKTTFNSATIGTFYGDTTLNISNADVTYGYMYVQGNLNVSDSTLQIDGGYNTYFRTGSADHSIVIDNTTWNSGAYTNMGSYDAATAGGSAIVTIKGGSTFNAGTFTLTTTEGTNHVVDLTVDNSKLNATTALKVGAGTSATFENGAVLNAAAITNEGYFKIGENATATVGSIVMDGNGMLDVWGQEGKIATLNAGSITAKGADSGFYSSYGDTTVDGTIELQGNFSIGESTLKADTFKNISGGYQQELRNVDLDVTNFINGVGTSDKYATVSGTSKVQIDNLSGYYALRLADDTTLKGGTNIVGTTSVRALGDVTFGETETDFIHIDSFDNNNAAGNTMTVNGTLDISSAGKGFSTYWLGINGNANTTTLTGAGTINSNTAAILQYGKIVVDKDLTINVTDQYAADLRFTLTDITIKGEINSIGSNNKLNAIQTSTVTLTGENAALNVDSYLLVGYQTYKGSNDITDMYKSTVTVEGGADLNVGGTLYINKSSSIMVDQNSKLSAGSIMNYGGMINSTTEGEIVVNQDMVIAGNITTDILTITQGAALSAGSLTVTNLNLAIGSDLSVAGASSIGTITVLGELVPENAEFVLVSSGWANLGETTVMYKGTEYTVTNSIEDLTGLNFVTIDGNLYVKDFGAEATGIYIGDLTGAVDGKITAPNGATYTVGEDAFASTEAAAEALGDKAAIVTTIALKSGDDVNAALAKFVNAEIVTIDDYAVINVKDGDLTIQNDGHLDANITAKDTMTITNTSVNTLLGSYSSDVEITVENAGGMIGDAADDATAFNTEYLTVNDGDATNVEVNAGILELTDTNTFGVNADSAIFAGDKNGAGQIFLNGSANMSIDGDVTTDVVIQGYTDEHTGTLTLNGNQTFSGDISANEIVVAGGKVVTFDQNTVDFNELNVAGTLNADFTQMDSFTNAGTITGDGNLNTTHDGTWIINDSVTRDVTGFAGTVTMKNADAAIVMREDKSYFSDDAEMVVNGAQNVYLAKDTTTTGIDFRGDGTLNVGNYDDAFADQSEDFTQVLTGDNTEFKGAINVSEGAKLTVENALGASSIDMDYEATQSATDVADEFDTQLILNKEGLELAAKITGDANDIIDVAEDATLSADEALNGFEGTVNVNDNTLVLGGVNETSAEFVGTGVINANANQTFTADNTDFVGTVNIAEDKALTLKGDFSQDEKGTIVFAKGADLNLEGDETDEVITIGAKLDNSAVEKGFLNSIVTVKTDSELTAEDAISNFKGRLDVNADKTLTLSGNNTTQANIQGSGTVELADGSETIELTLRNDRLVSGTPAGNSLSSFDGTFAVNDNKLNILTYTETGAAITGTSDAELNISKFTVAETGKSYKGTLTLKAEEALNGFDGTINLTESILNLKSANTTNAVVNGDTASELNISDVLTLNTTDAISGFNGTVQLYNADDKLTLIGTNSTAATVKGAGVIDADANQTFSGDVSGFSGLYDIAENANVTLSGTIADVINAQGDTLTLSNATGKDITVNAGTGSELENLAFGANNVVLGAGDGDDFTNVTGEGNITDFGQDQEFGTVKAGTIYVTGTQDALTIDDLAANINITVDGQQTDGKADVTVKNVFTGDIAVTIEDSEYLKTPYRVATNGGFTTDTTISLTVESNAASSLQVDDRVIIDGETYLLQLKENTLILTKLPGYSNHVVVDGDWTDKVPYQSVDDNGTERIIGYNAAIDLDKAVEYIKGRPEGLDWGIANGDAMIELTDGKYQLTTGTLMTDANGVTQLTLQGRDGQTATLTGVIVGSDGSEVTTLTMNNVRVQGDLYAGGNLVINNDASLRSTGGVIAAGVAEGDMANNSKLTINGGYFGNRLLVGGSYNNTTEEMTVSGDTAIVINNQSGEKLTITSNIIGGSWAAEGDVVQTGNASIEINVEQATQIRGNIFVNGGEGNGKLTMNGNSEITFKGDADLLTFTGTVSAIDGDSTTEAITFDGFKGTFNGSMSGFDVITIKGDSALELGRRQTKTGDTELNFTVNGDTTGANAMYTVRDADSWEFAKNINITVDGAKSGSYVLVDNYVGGFDGFSFTLNNAAYTLGSTITVNDVDTTVSVNENGQLILSQLTRTTSGSVSVQDGDVIEITSQNLTANNAGNAIALGDDVNADINLTNAGVEGAIHTGWYGTVNVQTNGNTEINGDITGYASGTNFTVAEGSTTINGILKGGNAGSVTINDGAALQTKQITTGSGANQITLGENATLSGEGVSGKLITTGIGNDTVTVGRNAAVTTAASIDMGTGNDTLTLEEGATVTTSEINGGLDTDTINMMKGSSITITAGRTNGIEQFNLDVDAILGSTSSNTGVNLNVTGIADLKTDVAGAKVVFGNVSSTSNLKLDDVDSVLGTATQIAGAETDADTSDDVWASLNKVNSDLVVSWGRSEAEVASALDAFKADNTLTLGDSIVASAATLDDSDDTNNFSKKDRGTLA